MGENDIDDNYVVYVTNRIMDMHEAEHYSTSIDLVVLEDSDTEGTLISTTDCGSWEQSGSEITFDCGYTSRACEYASPASLGQLRLGPLLGSGSFGKVYRSFQDDQAVAVKVVDCRGQDGTESRELDALQLTFDLDHPGVVEILDFASSTQNHAGNRRTQVWIVQELCDLGNLSHAAACGWLRVARSISAPPNMVAVLATLRDITDAMAYIHSRSIIHADLNGRNVLLARSMHDSRGFTAKVADFGLSRLSEDGEPVITSELGTITHMPPELLMKGMLTPLADVWALGIVAWEACHGRQIYRGYTAPQIVLKVVRNTPLEWSSDIPEYFTSFIGRVLAHDHERRPQFTSILADLDFHIAMDRPGTGKR